MAGAGAHGPPATKAATSGQGVVRLSPAAAACPPFALPVLCRYQCPDGRFEVGGVGRHRHIGRSSRCFIRSTLLVRGHARQHHHSYRAGHEAGAKPLVAVSLGGQEECGSAKPGDRGGMRQQWMRPHPPPQPTRERTRQRYIRDVQIDFATELCHSKSGFRMGSFAYGRSGTGNSTMWPFSSWIESIVRGRRFVLNRWSTKKQGPLGALLSLLRTGRLNGYLLFQ